MPSNSYLTIKDYVQGVPGIALLFTLHDFRGKEIDRQLVPKEKLFFTREGTVKLKYIVDELLTAKMVPGTYKLYLYTAYPKSEAAPPQAQEKPSVPSTPIQPMKAITANDYGTVYVVPAAKEAISEDEEQEKPPKILLPTDYVLDRCLTQKGIEIRVRGGLDSNSIGGSDE